MSAVLLIEISPDGQEWAHGGTLSPGQPEGSISQNWPDGKRDVIMFRCHGDCSVIRLSERGVDYEAGADRMIMSAGLREVARLGPGESFGMAVTSDKGLSYRVRWTHR